MKHKKWETDLRSIHDTVQLLASMSVEEIYIQGDKKIIHSFSITVYAVYTFVVVRAQ